MYDVYISSPCPTRTHRRALSFVEKKYIVKNGNIFGSRFFPWRHEWGCVQGPAPEWSGPLPLVLTRIYRDHLKSCLGTGEFLLLRTFRFETFLWIIDWIDEGVSCISISPRQYTIFTMMIILKISLPGAASSVACCYYAVEPKRDTAVWSHRSHNRFCLNVCVCATSRKLKRI